MRKACSFSAKEQAGERICHALAQQDLRGLVTGYSYAPLADIARYGPVLAGAVRQAVVEPAG